MNLAEIPLFAMLKGRLGHLSERQRVISQNVANSDTPGFTPSDIKAFNFDAQMKGVAMAQVQSVTQPGHMVSPSAKKGLGGQFKPVKARDSETTLDGNSVVLEDEMLKMA
ncbi:flagellar basal body protein, partial [Phenylobacterium sp.]|uniref:flagellar basal body protein n=1 Tax=Phenylobacterium sp. TaxID=1871053 RepID=UPI002869FBEE